MPARPYLAAVTLAVFAILMSACSFGGLLEPEPTPIPTRTRRPTSTATPVDTATPVPTATSTQSPTATSSPTSTPAPPTDTPTAAPPTLTPTRRPPTATFTAAPPTNTPLPTRAFPRWVDPGRPSTANECTFPNGTKVEGRLLRLDGSLITGKRATAAMHLWIEGFNTAPFAMPGAYKDFPTETDGTWNAEFPKLANKFTWHIFLSAPLSDDPISEDLVGTSDGVDVCGQPGTKNRFKADWIFP
jgi:hypothetical protein